MSDETGVSDRGSDVRAYGPPAAWQDSGGAADSRSNGSAPNGAASDGSLAFGPLSIGSASEGGLSAGNAQPAPSRKRGWLLAASGVILLAGSAAYFLRGAPLAPKAVDSPKVAAPAPPAPAPVATATLEFRAQPAHAQLFLDGQRLTSNPLSMQLPVNGSIHHLRAEAPGYAASSSDFSAQRDSTIEIVLTESAAPPNKTPATGHGWQLKHVPTSASAPAAHPTPTSGVGCQNPFFVDSDGIKKLRPECL